MAKDHVDARRRALLAGALGAAGTSGLARTARATDALASADPARVARDESYWAEVARSYLRTSGVTNLEHGYWGRMARPVLEQYVANLTRVNAEGAWYARRRYAEDHAQAVQRVADLLGAQAHEIALTRNATESIHNMVRQYRHLNGQAAVLYSDVDYPPFKRLVRSLEASHGVRTVRVALAPRTAAAEVLGRYRDALDANPSVRLMLATHASNQHGVVLPMASLAREARRRGVDLICDAAQSLGLVEYRIDDLGVDWAGFNLHKWIGAPLGLGAMYLRAGSEAPIAPYPGEEGEAPAPVAARVHTGTSDFAAVMTIGAAIDFHQAVGPANKEARLRYLRSLWSEPVSQMDGVEWLGATEEASWSGIGAFRLRGRRSVEDARSLHAQLQESGVFTVVRAGLDSGACVRVTPQVFTTPSEVSALVDAVRRISA